MPRVPRPIAERFWEKVAVIADRTSCWLWKAGTDDAGYGMMTTTQHKQERAHVLAWQLANGPLPQGLWVLHTCDTPRCVRNDGTHSHLYAGTHTENVRDRQARKRTASGMANGSNTHPEAHAKLFPLPTYREICALHATGTYTYKNLGALYGVKATTIWYIVKKRKYIF